jgi:uncharacterized MAPEG superfamily protein
MKQQRNWGRFCERDFRLPESIRKNDMEAKKTETPSAVGVTGRRKKQDPEDMLTQIHQDTGRAMKLLGFALVTFLTYFAACMTTFVSTGLDERYIWLAICLLAATASLVFLILASSRPVSEN